VSIKKSELERFIKTAQASLRAELAKGVEMRKQSWNPNNIAHGVYKIFVDGHYACTGTHVGNKMYVVLHCLDENSESTVKAVNNMHTIQLRTEDLVIVTPEIGYFPVNGIPSPFKKSSFKVLEDAAIVSVFGYGCGQSPEPDLVLGFASPQGWYNCATRDGDCTAPVLNMDGRIVGFHTHGNGKNFGRFEPVTKDFINNISDDVIELSGLAFQKRPSSLQK
jgi:hypothetical protein